MEEQPANKTVHFTDRIKTTAWTHASERNVPHLRDFQSTSPVVRTPPITDSPRPVDRAPSFPQDRKQKQPILPQPAAPPRLTQNASQPRSVSFSSSDPPSNTIEKEERATPVEDAKNPKPGIGPRMKAGSFRFAQHTKNAVFHSWINVLLVFVPVGIAVKYIPVSEISGDNLRSQANFHFTDARANSQYCDLCHECHRDHPLGRPSCACYRECS